MSGRLTKWAIDLGIYYIRYVPRVAKKRQVMTDFLVEMQSLFAELLHMEEEFQAWILTQMELQTPLVQGLELY